MSNTSYYVKSKLAKIRSSIDLMKFLVSEGYRAFLQKTVWGVTGNYDLKVIFSQGVYTDNKVISVNPVHPYVLTLKDLPKMTLCILGQLAHEIFHILYTDFKTLKEIEKRYKQYGTFRMKQVHESMNIIEDSAIELAGTNYYTGSFSKAIMLNNQNALENMPSLDELFVKGAPRLSIFKQACAMYCILGTMKGKLHDPELIALFKKAMPILDKGRLAPNSWGRLAAAEELYNLMIPLIEEVEKQAQQQQSQDNYQYTKNQQISSGGPQGTPQQQPQVQQDFQKSNKKKTKEEIEKEEEEQNASSGQGDEAEEEDNNSSSKQQSKGSKSDKEEDTEDESNSAGSGNEEGEESDEENSSTGDGSEGEDEDDKSKSQNQKESNSNNDDDSEDSEDGDGDSEENSSNGDAGDPNTNSNSGSGGEDEGDTSENQNSEDDETEEENDDDQSNIDDVLKNLEEQLEGVKDDVAKDEYDRQEQLAQDKAIREFSKNVSYSALHSHIRVEVGRNFAVDEAVKQCYEESFDLVKGLTRNLSKRLVEVIKFNEDARYTGLYSGKLNKSQMFRTDKKVFYKNKSKSDEADLVIAIGVDESGSMSGDRIKYARMACMMMYEVCKSLNIPLAIIGHSAQYKTNRVYHRHYVDFDSRDRNEKYKLARMTTYDNTREGVSVKYIGEYLKTRPETDKILISISDGDPYHPSAQDVYCDETARKDTGRVVKDLEADGIKVFGVAIGDGKSAIKQIYTHNYIDIPSINLLPARLISLIERNMFK